MAKAAADLATGLSQRLKTLESTRAQVEVAATGGSLSRQTAEHLYEGLLLGAYTAFESFLEQLFVGLLVSGPRGIAVRDCHPRVQIGTHSIARSVLLAPKKKWVDWMPFERTVELAEVFFRGGRPFSDLKRPDVEELGRISLLRNAVAHRSAHSMQRFERDVICGVPLPARERRPSGFLRGLLTASPRVTRYEAYVTHFVKVATQLTR